WTMSGQTAATVADTAFPTGSIVSRVGTNDFSAGQCTADIAAILVYDHKMTSSDMTAVEAYLQRRYGTSLTTPVSVSPTSATVATTGTQTFTGGNGSGSGYTYILTTNNSGGSVDPSTGVYTAGS